MNIPVFMSAFTHDVADDKEDRKVIIFMSNNNSNSNNNTCRIRDTSVACKIKEILNYHKCFIYL